MDALKPGGDIALQMKKAAIGGAVEEMRLAAEGAEKTLAGARRAAHRGACLRRLRHPSERGRPPGRSPSGFRGSTPSSTLSRPTSTTPGRRRSRRDHRIRPHRARQRHGWHRPWHGDGRVPCGGRARGRAGDRRLAEPQGRAPLRGPRLYPPPICAACSRACWPTNSGCHQRRSQRSSSPIALA